MFPQALISQVTGRLNTVPSSMALSPFVWLNGLKIDALGRVVINV